MNIIIQSNVTFFSKSSLKPPVSHLYPWIPTCSPLPHSSLRSNVTSFERLLQYWPFRILYQPPYFYFLDSIYHHLKWSCSFLSLIYLLTACHPHWNLRLMTARILSCWPHFPTPPHKKWKVFSMKLPKPWVTLSPLWSGLVVYIFFSCYIPNSSWIRPKSG